VVFLHSLISNFPQPQQKRIVEDTERRLNMLFDALNCETLSPPVLEQLHDLTEGTAISPHLDLICHLIQYAAVKRRDHNQSLAIHASLLTNGSRTDDIGLWMSGIKQLLVRL
jgi:protein transport protein SEC31